MRPGVTWVIVGAVLVVGVFAALDGVRSSGGEPAPAPAEPDGAVTTAQQDGGAELEASREIPLGGAVQLLAGRVGMEGEFGRFLTFRVPLGWYGWQGGGGFVIGNGYNEGASAVDTSSGGIRVVWLDTSLTEAARILKSVGGIRVADESPVRVGGHGGRKYSLEGTSAPLFEVTLRPDEPEPILLRFGQRAIFIQRTFANDELREEVDQILRSFRFSDYPSGSAEYEIEQLGNRWARLFGAGQTCNRFMGQPTCEWVACETFAGPIPNCAPVSPKVQRSFAGAVVRDIVIRGKWAAARFSNGEILRFARIGFSDDWGIDRVAAGRRFFE
jgi:hypothetical protein